MGTRNGGQRALTRMMSQFEPGMKVRVNPKSIAEGRGGSSAVGTVKRDIPEDMRQIDKVPVEFKEGRYSHWSNMSPADLIPITETIPSPRGKFGLTVGDPVVIDSKDLDQHGVIKEFGNRGEVTVKLGGRHITANISQLLPEGAPQKLSKYSKEHIDDDLEWLEGQVYDYHDFESGDRSVEDYREEIADIMRKNRRLYDGTEYYYSFDDAQPGEKMVMYERDGSGYPGSPPEPENSVVQLDIYTDGRRGKKLLEKMKDLLPTVEVRQGNELLGYVRFTNELEPDPPDVLKSNGELLLRIEWEWQSWPYGED